MAEAQQLKAELSVSTCSKETLATHLRAGLLALKVDAEAVEAALKDFLVAQAWKEVGVKVSERRSGSSVHVDVVTEFPLLLPPLADNWEFEGHAPILGNASSTKCVLPGGAVLHYKDLNALVSCGKHFVMCEGFEGHYLIAFSDHKWTRLLGYITAPFIITKPAPKLTGPGEGAWHNLLARN